MSKLDDEGGSSVVVPEDHPRQRLENFVADFFSQIASRSQARKLAKKGAFRVNQEPALGNVWLSPGDRVLYQAPEAPAYQVYELELEVPVEDEHWALVIKPAGLPVSGNRHRTLVRALPFNLTPSAEPDALQIPHTVHRLDIRVGGLMVVAKTARAQVELGWAFERRQVQKRYRALVVGRIEGCGRIEEPIEGRSASTRYAVVQHTPGYRAGWWTTLDLWPETGRTHQLRRHMAALGAPIVGDDLYTGDVPNIRKKGLYLYSTGVSIAHPISGKLVDQQVDEPIRYETRRRSERRRIFRSG
jgi:RluA family pseudouridine synthase